MILVLISAPPHHKATTTGTMEGTFGVSLSVDLISLPLRFPLVQFDEFGTDAAGNADTVLHSSVSLERFSFKVSKAGGQKARLYVCAHRSRPCVSFLAARL